MRALARTAATAGPACLAVWTRATGGIGAFHHIRDTTVAEDASQMPRTPLGSRIAQVYPPDAAVDA